MFVQETDKRSEERARSTSERTMKSERESSVQEV